MSYRGRLHCHAPSFRFTSAAFSFSGGKGGKGGKGVILVAGIEAFFSQLELLPDELLGLADRDSFRWKRLPAKTESP